MLRDSFDKDLTVWKTRDKDDSSEHLTLNQLFAKIKTIQEESSKLMALESDSMRQSGYLMTELREALEKFKEEYLTILSSTSSLTQSASCVDISIDATSKPSVPTSNTQGNGLITREHRQLMEEREKALYIVLEMLHTYGLGLISTLKAERRRIFSVSDVMINV